MSSAWQSDWSAFVDFLAERLSSGVSPVDFAGERIRWEGRLKKKRINGLAPGVVVSMLEKEIHLGLGRSEILDGLALPVANTSLAQWNSIIVGSQICFTAVFVPATSPFPPVEIKHFDDFSTLFIRLKDAAPA